ncbi:MAG: response regulator [Verrucomicrobiota bacterium]
MHLTDEQKTAIRECAKDEASFEKILQILTPVSPLEKSYQILTVDDDPTINTFIHAVLEIDGYNVCGVTSGQAAVEKINAQRWDLIFLDIIIPDIDGGQILNIIRESELNKDTPVAFVTGMIKPEEEEGLVPRREKYIGKPFTVEKLRAVTRELLKIGVAVQS